MNSDRIKEIQETTAYPKSVSVQQALLQVWNECAAEMYSKEDLKEAFKSCYTPFSFDRIGDLDQDFNIWFEQFKKK